MGAPTVVGIHDDEVICYFTEHEKVEIGKKVEITNQ